MSTIRSRTPADLPPGIGGSAAAEFAPFVRAFARAFGNGRGTGAAFALYRDDEPLVDIWIGAAGEVPWTRDTGTIVFSATKGIAATVVHRLADRGLLDYSAPVAEYWPEFRANGKRKITVRQLMSHRAGLSAVKPLVTDVADVLDHRLMEHRLAAAKPDHLLGVPAYHAITFGWLVSGLTRAITGADLRELFRTEVAEPLGIGGLHLGRPPAGAGITYAPLAGLQLGAVGKSLSTAFLGRSHRFPGALGAVTRGLFLPGLERTMQGTDPPILETELGSANAVCTASALAAMYSALACDGSPDECGYLGSRTMKALRRIETFQLDRALFYAPMLWRLGYHSIPIPGARAGFGHIGIGGSFGWAEPRLGLSAGFVHNRFSATQLGSDQSAAFWLLPLALKCLRNTRVEAPLRRTAQAA
ncbi:serine hydrolase domain-containing protein [Nocardia sp. 004]|uniref:serine hydrolase domain-containing protein n=1 Tax=Nocardia sp. 004 TaxID=3385978 RepID=UPI0039A0E086